MPVHAGMQAHADGPANGLGDLALVDGPQAGLVRVLDAAHGGHELGDEGDVLIITSPVFGQFIHQREPKIHLIGKRERKKKKNRPCSYRLG